MKLLIISDLHLNTTAQINRDETIANYLLTNINKKYVIILLGDIFDIIKNELIKPKREFQAIKSVYPLTVDLIENNDSIIYIKGNHDAILERKAIVDVINEEYNIKLKNFSIHFEHGHMFDLPNGKCHLIGDSVARTWGCCTNNCKNEDFLDNLETLGDISQSHKNLKKGAKKLKKYYDLVVFGHTHRRYCKLWGDNKIYLNTGYFSKPNGLIDEIRIKTDKKGKICIWITERRLETDEITENEKIFLEIE